MIVMILSEILVNIDGNSDKGIQSLSLKRKELVGSIFELFTYIYARFSQYLKKKKKKKKKKKFESK